MNNHPASSTDKDAHNAMGDYALWQGAAHPQEYRRVYTVMRRGEPVKIVETQRPSFTMSEVNACRNLFVTRMRSILDTGDADQASSLHTLRQMWTAQGFDPQVIERAIAAYNAEEEAIATLVRSYEEAGEEPLII